MDITYHMVPISYFEAQNPSHDYLPLQFKKDGFIHCTDGEFMLSGVAYNLYRSIHEDLLILFIDKNRVKSKIQYDDHEKLFPHIYGPLNRDAIVKVIKMARDRRGDWIFPITEIETFD